MSKLQYHKNYFCIDDITSSENYADFQNELFALNILSSDVWLRNIRNIYYQQFGFTDDLKEIFKKREKLITKNHLENTDVAVYIFHFQNSLPHP
jgi:hypothetical protein